MVWSRNLRSNLFVKNKYFETKKILKMTIALYAIRNNFQFKVYKSDVREYVLKCDVVSCKWIFTASKIGETDMFKIRYIRNEHNCSLDVIICDHRQANSALIDDCVKHKYKIARTI